MCFCCGHYVLREQILVARKTRVVFVVYEEILIEKNGSFMRKVNNYIRNIEYLHILDFSGYDFWYNGNGKQYFPTPVQADL